MESLSHLQILTSLLKRWVSTCKHSHIVSYAAGWETEERSHAPCPCGGCRARGRAMVCALPGQEWQVGLHPSVGCTVDCLGFRESLRLDTFLVDSYEHSFRYLGSAGSPEAFSLLYGQQHDPGKFLPVQLLSRLSSLTQPTEKGCYSFPLTAPLRYF